MRSMRYGGKIAAALLGAAALSGCRLVDQTSFGGAARAPAPDALSAALRSDGTVPILAVRPDDAVPYDAALRQAIASAEARNPATRFRLVCVVPAVGDARAQQRALAAGAESARPVLGELADAGVGPERISLDVRADPAIAQRELRLYGS